LVGRRQVPHDGLNGGPEAHVKEPVRLIHHQDLLFVIVTRGGGVG
jgi:hypothetical protein